MIKKILLLMVISCSSYAMSFNQAEVVYNKLVRSNGFTNYPRLVYSSSRDVNASAGGLRITVNAGLLRFVRNSNELAVVLGHELAHYRLAHHGSTPSNEYAADSLGASYAAKGGYNRCDGAKVILRFHDKGSKTHPPSDKRYNRIKC